jgi:AraC-like DNA-binding protein
MNIAIFWNISQLKKKMKPVKKQDFLCRKHKRILCSPEKWHIISSLSQPDHAPREDISHREWLRKNGDRHQAKEILLVMEGNSLNSLNGLIYPATPGTIFIFDSYESHDRFYHPATEGALHLWIFFLKTQIIARVLHVNRGKIDNSRNRELILENSRICDLFDLEWGNMKNSVLDGDLKRRKMLSLISLLFFEILEQFIYGKTAESVDETRQARIIHVIHQHICSSSGGSMTVEKLARIAGYSKFHFFRLFKKHIGKNVHDCINESRLNKTDKMLKEGFLQKQISDELGFSCPSAFSNWYARHKKA